ncbi:MAG: hypothetical protein OHK0045_06660 [Raineya sp.]
MDRINALRIIDTRFTDDLLSVAVTAEIIDSEKKKAITDHGFCYTIGYSLPTLGDGTSDTLSLGEVSNEAIPFEGIISRLKPSNDYYIRAYIVIDGKVVYSPPKFVRTRDFIPEDFNLLVSNALLTENEISVKAFVNKIRIETRDPVTVWQYGSIVAAEPDSTNGLSSTYTQSPPDPITHFHDSYPINLLPVPTAPSNKIYVWAYADIFLNENPSITHRIYSRRREIEKLN